MSQKIRVLWRKVNYSNKKPKTQKSNIFIKIKVFHGKSTTVNEKTYKNKKWQMFENK